MDKVRVRFAPSPTGYLHIGGARTALFNWLFARKMKGTFILRIEDTDVERSTPEAVNEILEGLKWLGLDWDEGPNFQSERIELHKEIAQQLVQKGFAYPCFCTKEELEKRRKEAIKQKRAYKYEGTCRDLTKEEVEKKKAQGIPFVIRFKVPHIEGCVSFDDVVYGHIEKRYEDIEDFVIVRSDGKPLYVLSNAVDDIYDRITHVIRGQDGLANTPKQILIYKALDKPLPVFAHMPLTLDSKKAKISKRRHGEVVTVSFYKKRGFIPWALCNFLVLLGWSSNDGREFFTKEELIEAFSLEGISRHNSIFNYNPDNPTTWTDPKALSMNARYLSRMSLDELIPYIKEELKEAGLWKEEYEGKKRKWFEDTINLIRTRYHTLKDFSTLGRCYFSEDYPFDQKAVEKNLKPYPFLREYLLELSEELNKLAEFNLQNIEKTIREFAEKKQIKAGIIINAIRTAVTGLSVGPGLFEILVVVGKQSTVSRLRKAISFI